MTDPTVFKKPQPAELAQPAMASDAIGDVILALDLGTITG